MTWLKIGEEFPVEVAKADLSDAAFRLHIEGLAYAMDRENDGRFSEREVKRFAECSNYAVAIQELVDAGFWQRVGAGELQIVHHMEAQPSSAYLMDKRQNEATRQRRKREMDALIAAGYNEDEAEAELVKRGIPVPKSGRNTGRNTGGKSQGVSRRDNQRDKQRDVTRDPERSGTERSGTELHSLDEEVVSSEEQKQRIWDRPPSNDPLACKTCSQGRLTDYLVSQGKTSCNDCASKQRSAA